MLDLLYYAKRCGTLYPRLCLVPAATCWSVARKSPSVASGWSCAHMVIYHHIKLSSVKKPTDAVTWHRGRAVYATEACDSGIKCTRMPDATRYRVGTVQVPEIGTDSLTLLPKLQLFASLAQIAPQVCLAMRVCLAMGACQRAACSHSAPQRVGLGCASQLVGSGLSRSSRRGPQLACLA